jgi:hypothetical protein
LEKKLNLISRYEAEIFAFLGLKYKEPNQRIGFASVELLGDNVKAKVANIKKKRTLKAKSGDK